MLNSIIKFLDPEQRPHTYQQFLFVNRLGKEIVSASFTIIAEYETDPPFIHIDLYRIEHGAELDDLGIRSITGGGSISVIEWAEKARGELQEDIIKVGLQTRDEQTREISIEGLDEKDWNHR